MPNILLTHTVHGSKFALSDAEVEHDEKHGWMRYTDDTPVKAASRKGGKKQPQRSSQSKKPVEEAPAPTETPIEQPNEVPDFLTPASDESEGE